MRTKFTNKTSRWLALPNYHSSWFKKFVFPSPYSGLSKKSYCYFPIAHYTSDDYYKQLPRLSFRERYPLTYNLYSNTILYNIRHPHQTYSKITSLFSNKNNNFTVTPVYNDDKLKLINIIEDIRTKNTTLDKIRLYRSPLQSPSPAYCSDSSRNPTISLFPGFFYSKKTIAPELFLIKTQEARIKAYEAWLISQSLHPDNESRKEQMQEMFESQLTVDSRRAFYGLMLSWYQSPEIYDDIRRFIIGHEISHLVHNDVITRPLLLSVSYILTSIALNTFSLPLIPCFILKLFISRLAEKRCDLWSADINTARGGIRFFEDTLRVKTQLLEKYPEFGSTVLKSNLLKWTSTHPPVKDRIEYLKDSPSRSL